MVLQSEELYLNSPPRLCTDDFDCEADAGLCYKNVSWFNYSSLPGWSPDGEMTGFCECSTWYSFRSSDGVQCDQIAGVSGIFVFVFFGVLSVVAFTCAIIGTVDFVQLIATNKRTGTPVTFDASFVTLASVILALAFHLGWSISTILIAHDPTAYTVKSLNQEGEKLSTWSANNKFNIFFTILFSFVAAINISVMWIELAFRAKSLKTRIRTQIHYYKKAVQAVTVLFVLIMGSVAAIGAWNLATLVAFPFLAGLLVTFTVGRVRMTAVLAHAMSLEGSSKQTGANESMEAGSGSGGSFMKTVKRDKKKKDAKERTRRAMVAIKRVSTHVILGILGVLLSGIGYLLTNDIIWSAGWKEVAPTRGFSWVTLVNSCIPLALLYVNCAIFFYAHRNTKKVVRRARGGQFSSASGTGSKQTSEAPSSMLVTTYAPGNLGAKHAKSTEDEMTPSVVDLEMAEMPSVAPPKGEAPEAPEM